MPQKFKIAIIGGGVMGCSLAYHLAKQGMGDVILLEKSELTSGSTWHAAGQMTHSVSHYGLAKMVAYGTELCDRLEDETGQSCTWHKCGSLRLAFSEDEADYMRYTYSVGRGLGLSMEIIGRERMAELHPFYSTEGVVSALYTPDDGHVDPAGLTFAFAAGARQNGVTIRRHDRVLGLARNGNLWHVECESGDDIECELVINAGGTYAHQIGEWVGLNLPIANSLHHYLVTDTVPEFENLKCELPVIREDKYVSGYIRMEQKCGLIGIYEKEKPATIWDDGTPWDVEHELFDADYDRIMPWLEGAFERMPILAERGIKRIVHGAIPQTPDGNMLLGPSGVPGFWLCCGAQVGIAWGAGAGKYLAQYITEGSSDVNLAAFDGRRFGARIDKEYRIVKAKEDYVLRHELPYPHLDRPACRPSHSKLPPIYEKLKAQGAVFQNIYGWERPYFYAPKGVAAEHIYGFRHNQLHGIIGNEVKAVRAGAGICDLTAFAKILLAGKDVESFLLRVTSNRLPKRERLGLTYFINSNGRVEGEATIINWGGEGAEGYELVYSAVKELAILEWLQEQMLEGEDVIFKNISADEGVLGVFGAKARDIVGSALGIDCGNSAFPWLSVKKVEFGGMGGRVRAMRLNYGGELGWELHVPFAVMEALYDKLLLVGGDDLIHVGMGALNSMRMDKGYKSGHEITSEVTLYEAGLMRFARDGGGFQGSEISMAESDKWCLVYGRIVGCDSDAHGGESVWLGDRSVGSVSSCGYSYYGECVLVWAYVAVDAIQGNLEVMLLGERYRLELLDKCLYDVDNERQKN